MEDYNQRWRDMFKKLKILLRCHANGHERAVGLGFNKQGKEEWSPFCLRCGKSLAGPRIPVASGTDPNAAFIKAVQSGVDLGI